MEIYLRKWTKKIVPGSFLLFILFKIENLKLIINEYISTIDSIDGFSLSSPIHPLIIIGWSCFVGQNHSSSTSSWSAVWKCLIENNSFVLFWLCFGFGLCVFQCVTGCWIFLFCLFVFSMFLAFEKFHFFFFFFFSNHQTDFFFVWLINKVTQIAG